MTPAAIVQAAIEILSEQAARPGPLDLILARYLRSRRYIGSKDRSALTERLFGLARRHARVDWRLAEAGAAPSPRARVIADLALSDGLDLGGVSQVFDGAGYGPEPLTAAELTWLAALGPAPLETEDMPAATRLECPDWAWPGFVNAFGDRADEELTALLAPAPLDLRVNRLKTDRVAARGAIRAAGFEVRDAPFAPDGLRLAGRVALGRLPGLLDGAVDPQDAGSQLVAQALDPQPGERVADFCAGAGGKTLALAAAMGNKGQLLALDVDGRRLDRAAPRLAKAGVDNVQRREIKAGADPWLKRQSGRFDRVLIDAPCSGVGAWRRNPDARWSRGQPPLGELTALQATILDRAARLVRPGGLLVYATCSLLPEENDDQIAAFLERTTDFRLDPPPTFPAPLDGPYLRLTPARHNVDGFFACWLRRAGSKANPAAVGPPGKAPRNDAGNSS